MHPAPAHRALTTLSAVDLRLRQYGDVIHAHKYGIGPAPKTPLQECRCAADELLDRRLELTGRAAT